MFLGVAAVLGFDPAHLLRAKPVEAAVLTEAVREAHEYATRRDQNLAIMIVNAYAEAQRKARRGRH